jgi:hypothetical protein
MYASLYSLLFCTLSAQFSKYKRIQIQSRKEIKVQKIINKRNQRDLKMKKRNQVKTRFKIRERKQT